MELRERAASKLNAHGVTSMDQHPDNSLPIHVGIDSKTMVDKAIVLMEVACRCNDDSSATQWIKLNPLTKPWGLQPDRGLWELEWEACLTRGTHAQQLTKVNGHATVKQVELAEVEEHHKKGNDQADKFADYGVYEHVTWIHARHSKYCELIKHVQYVIIAVLRGEKDERAKRLS